jgi:hypothetical protein
MKKIILLSLISLSSSLFAQEVISPMQVNREIFKAPQLSMSGDNTIDSIIIHVIDTLELPLVDDFSINRFEQYDADYDDAGVTGEWYYHLMNETNTIPQDPTLIFCDSNKAHSRVITITEGDVEIDTNYTFTPFNVYVNDLTEYPVEGQLRQLFQECYVLIDSIIDGVPDEDQDTLWYNAEDGPAFRQDSAHVFTAVLDNPGRIWQDNFAFHNYTYAVDPWSLGVATLDGVDENGWPYDIGNDAAFGVGDYLTSKPLNLVGASDVWVTFVYQAQGFGNAPDEFDSLLVEFWSVAEERWLRTPSFAGLSSETGVNNWDTAHIKVPEPLYSNGFKIRLKSYASLSGALDHWHIDYFSLKADEGPLVEDFSDLAIAYPLNTLLEDYTSVPWDHYKNTTGNEKMLERSLIKVYNSDATNTLFAPGDLTVKYNDVLQGGSPFVIPSTGIPEPNYILGMNDNYFDVAEDYYFDQALGGVKADFDVRVKIASAVAGENNLNENDTTNFTQRFSNFYAYDDGSAETAYGVTGEDAQLAYRFEAYEPGELTGVLFHFVPTIDDLSSEIFLLTVWADNDGQPGEIIYQDDFFNTHSPEYSGALNGYKYLTFTDDIYLPVDQVFYVGWENIDDLSLNIGADWNIDNKKNIFFNTDGESWANSIYDISLMIRPVFSTDLDFTLSNPEEKLQTPDIKMYPNPMTSVVNIVGVEDGMTVDFYDLSGRLVLSESSNNKEIDVALLQTGLYVVQVNDQNGHLLYATKLMKN